MWDMLGEDGSRKEADACHQAARTTGDTCCNKLPAPIFLTDGTGRAATAEQAFRSP